MMNKGYLGSGGTKASDEVLTPRYGVEPIVKHIKDKGYNIIWCPFDDYDSMFVRVLESHGFEVIYSHIDEGEDFFEYEPPVYDCIVSNPPFSIKDKILKRLYDLGRPFAVILPQNALQSIDRVNMYIKYGLEYLGFDRRINYYTKGELNMWKPTNHFASAYFCKDVLPKNFILEKLTPIQEHYYDFKC